MYKLTTAKGFTLIEVIIVMAILAILGAVGYPAYGNWVKNASFRSKARTIAGELMAARSQAVGSNTNVLKTIPMASDATMTLKWRDTITPVTGACTQTSATSVTFFSDGSASTLKGICLYDTTTGVKRYEVVVESTTTGRVIIR